jgi:hypothetical protein
MNVPPLSTSDVTNKEYTTLGWATKLEYILSKTHSLIMDLQRKKSKRNEKISGNVKATTFKENDKVLLYRPQVLSGDSRKISVHWYGPYTVDKVARNGKVYYLKDPLNDPLKYPVSISLLKSYTQREGEEDIFNAFPGNAESFSLKDALKDDDSSPNRLLDWSDKEDNYIPPVIPPSDVDEEEKAVLQELKSSKGKVTLRTLNPQQQVKTLRKPQIVTTSDKRKVRRHSY